MKIEVNLRFISLLVFGIISLLTGCEREYLPSVSTNPVVQVTSFSARGGGNVTDVGNPPVTQQGVVWDISPMPTWEVNLGHSLANTGAGSFTVNILPLSANTTYYVRAFATNEVGTAYGNQVSFTTIGDPPVASFTCSPNPALAGQIVQFTDDSYAASSWYWDFGDGTTSTAKNPTHIYTNAGTYSVTLTVTNNYGSDYHSSYIIVNQQYSYYIKYVCDDAYVDEENPDENYGNEPILNTGPGYYIYLRFDIRDIFDYIDRYNLSCIEKVEIRLAIGYNNTIVKPIGTTKLYGISWGETSWYEELVTYNTRPQHGNEIAELQNITFDISDIVAFNVKSDFLNCVQLHNYYSVMVSTPSLSPNYGGYFYSKELKNYYPEYGDGATPVLWIQYKAK